ncbi:MAG: L-2-amino-thiazoline-4-carboxylic acid hydrolase [Spirochaetaceae bacterium]|nr:L-2-amino-thiazoline-4-carboxylic acid hydrolase [Spirochaetaceae bacterium]
MSDIVNSPTIDEDMTNMARSCIEHRATWMALTYLEMEKRGVDAESITRAAVHQCGNIHGLRFRGQCVDPENMEEFNGVFLPTDSKKNFEINVTKCDQNNIYAEFHYCALVNAWKKLGLDDEKIAKFCDIAMDGDRGIAESMGYKLDLTDKISEGCKTCRLHFHK